MSTLIVDELYPGVVFSQKLIITKSLGIAYIRPWIYKQGTLVDGDFVCTVKDGATIIKTATINYTDINAAITGTYAHGFIRFDMDPLSITLPDETESKEYTIEFEMINHTQDPVNFIGINRSWENKIYETTVVAPNDMVEPAGIEIYEIKENL